MSADADGCRRCAGEPLPSGAAATGDGAFAAYTTTLCDDCLLAADTAIRRELATARKEHREARERYEAAGKPGVLDSLTRAVACTQTAYLEITRQLQAIGREAYRRGLGFVGDLQWL